MAVRVTDRVTVLGGSIAGLSTALFLARLGHEVVVLDRDEATGAAPPLGTGEHQPRRATAQAAHSHIFLAAIRELLLDRAPDVLDAMVRHGVRELPLRDGLPPTLQERTGAPTLDGGHPGLADPMLIALASRRATVEEALARRRHRPAGRGDPRRRRRGRAARRGRCRHGRRSRGRRHARHRARRRRVRSAHAGTGMARRCRRRRRRHGVGVRDLVPVALLPGPARPRRPGADPWLQHRRQLRRLERPRVPRRRRRVLGHVRDPARGPRAARPAGRRRVRAGGRPGPGDRRVDRPGPGPPDQQRGHDERAQEPHPPLRRRRRPRRAGTGGRR